MMRNTITVRKDKIQLFSIYSLAQGFSLQATYSSASPNPCSAQVAPPYSGAGFVQFRVRCINPPPQVFEHSLQSDQSV